MVTYNYTAPSSVVVPITITSAYTAAVNDWVIADCSAGSVVITLPTAPANLSTVAVKRYDATYASGNMATVAPGGSDAFLGGSTTPAQLLLQGQALVLQYNSITAQWGVRSIDLPLSQLDSRYLNTTGTAATATKLATARKINGVPFDGTADINATLGFAPTDYSGGLSFINWNYDLSRGNTATSLVAGEAYLMMVPIRAAVTITNVFVSIGTAGSGLTSGQCFAGLFDSGGNLLSATADQSTNWQSTGLKTMALTTPQGVSAGFYYVGFFATGTTMPKPWCDNTIVSNVGAVGPFATTPRCVLDTTHTGLTTAFHTPASLQQTNTAFWVAVS